MKSIVEVTGNFLLVDPTSRQMIEPDRPYVIRPSEFINQRAIIGQIRVLANDIPDCATDEEFAKFCKECNGDTALAIASFKEQLRVKSSDSETAEEQPKPRRKK